MVTEFAKEMIKNADIAQSAEHILGKDEVVRSNRINSSSRKP